MLKFVFLGVYTYTLYQCAVSQVKPKERTALERLLLVSVVMKILYSGIFVKLIVVKQSRPVTIALITSNVTWYFSPSKKWLEWDSVPQSGIEWLDVPSIQLIALNFIRKMRMAQKILEPNWVESCPLEPSDAKNTIFRYTQIDSTRLDSMACDLPAHSSDIECSWACSHLQ